MSYSFIVKQGQLEMTASYENGILAGDDYLVARLLDEVAFMEDKGLAIIPYNYVPPGKYLKDALAVKLIADTLFDDIRFVGDVPEIEPDSLEGEE